ncbi:hypothetical protein Tco_0672652 [Tanacetum coccineum]
MPRLCAQSFVFVFLAFGWLLEEINVTWVHLEKKRTRPRLYTNYLEANLTERRDGVANHTRRRHNTQETASWISGRRLRKKKLVGVGKVYNWKTATYSKIWYDEDVHGPRSVETVFSAIVLNDALTSEAALLCEPTVSPLEDNKIDFRISFDESDDEDCTPTVSYFDDLDHFKDFRKEFTAIIYNDALTSKLDFLTEPTVSPQHIDEFNLKDEALFSECEEEEQNVLHFNDLFPFNVIYPDDSKSDKDNGNDKIDIEQSSGGNVIDVDDGAYAHGSNKLLETRPSKINRQSWLMYLQVWKSRDVRVLKSQDGCSTHDLANKLNMDNLSSKYQGSFSF